MAIFSHNATGTTVITVETAVYQYHVHVLEGYFPFLCCSGSDGGLEARTTVTVSVTDVADVAPTLTPYTFVTMAEELPYGTVIGQLFELTDPDTNDNITYTIAGQLCVYY